MRASSESPLESASSAEALVGTVESAERFSDASVAIGVEFADALSPAIGASGTLTSVRVGPGDTVDTGKVVADVNNVPVIAYVSEAPLWRDVARGTKGDDVRIAQQLLADLGFLEGKADGDAGLVTDRAIRAFNKKHGFGTNNGALSLSSLMWVGTAPVTVDKLEVALGDSVGSGTAMFTTTAGLAAITVSETPNVPRDAEVELIVDGVTAPYEPGTGRITDPDAVVAIAGSLGTATEGVGTVRLVTPLTVGTVPSSAVVTDERGTACIFADAASDPITVEPLGGTLGTVDLDPALVGQSVLINPREVRADLSCGS
jgi:peptidoglycan hydrolase-like protein with peptidoglycan-binding domain